MSKYPKVAVAYANNDYVHVAWNFGDDPLEGCGGFAIYRIKKGTDGKGQPLWSKEIADRGAVFTHRGRCFRSGITFNAGLERYLWVQILPGTQGKKADTRFEGGFAVYDAPEPWGPWTTAFFTEKWDAGPGEKASFPTKWMSADGKTMHLVFSGDDHFAVRKARVRVIGR